jgi:hypothetical protein
VNWRYCCATQNRRGSLDATSSAGLVRPVRPLLAHRTHHGRWPRRLLNEGTPAADVKPQAMPEAARALGIPWTLGVRAKRLHPPQHPRNLYRLPLASATRGRDAAVIERSDTTGAFCYTGFPVHFPGLRREPRPPEPTKRQFEHGDPPSRQRRGLVKVTPAFWAGGDTKCRGRHVGAEGLGRPPTHRSSLPPPVDDGMTGLRRFWGIFSCHPCLSGHTEISGLGMWLHLASYLHRHLIAL